MPLSHGRSYLAIPGPSVMPDRVLQAMHRAAPNIYAGEVVDMMPGLIDGLRSVARTQHNVAIYIANGHGTWEAALSNTLSPGGKVLSLCTGRFGHGWHEMATGLGIVPVIEEFGMQAPVNPERIEELLRADTTHDLKAVLLTHVDTSTSIRNDVMAARAAMNAAGHPALLMVDCIASMGCDRFEMDAWGVDVAVAASQKGLMVPPGVGFVFFNDKAAAVQANLSRVSRYWDWAPRANPDLFYQYFGGTAPTHHLYGLRESLAMIAEEGGIEAVWARHAHLAQAIWAAFDIWAADGPLQMNVADPALRSTAVTSLHVGAPYGTALRDWTEQKMGVTLGIGLGMSTPDDPKGDGFFRLGHMGHVNAPMVMGALSAIQSGLIALGIPHGDGALPAAAKVIAEA
ncbi:pyridoxal-phosphate-dependent aminotransferase family protein [Aliiroseovarius halocynthiae]|uniref:Aminotransferase class V-fold PLP-dependent enzyme n=1 Tax=Aliiroseovarius halocynthiae TaxID=985055 RepID=A0A545SMP8_9RHOB|nr:aminotransferase class V-fold PLP-dependent enzyme [Aliiroseovarius halocynthiae]TQV66282.1 aminotransferase class V-fold PLP-dependent enzyme [Aliiroseovarius halocynthiae]